MKKRFSQRNLLCGLLVLVASEMVSEIVYRWAVANPKAATAAFCGIVAAALFLTKWKQADPKRLVRPD